MRLLGPAISLAVFSVALFVLSRELSELSLASLWTEMRAIPASRIALAMLSTVMSYSVLTGCDAAALKYLGKRLPFRVYGRTSFMAYAIGHNVGLGALTGGSVRYRMYSENGLSVTEVARLAVFVSVTFAIGAAGILGVALIAMPADTRALLGVPLPLLTGIGIFLVAVPIAYVAAAMVWRRPIGFRGWRFVLPTRRLAVRQVVLCTADLLFASGTLYVLLAPNAGIGYISFLGIYLLALAAGLISTVPGGIGVFEAILIAALPMIPDHQLLSVIIVYRVIYYLVPLCLALALLVGYELRQRHEDGPPTDTPG